MGYNPQNFGVSEYGRVVTPTPPVQQLIRPQTTGDGTNPYFSFVFLSISRIIRIQLPLINHNALSIDFLTLCILYFLVSFDFICSCP